MVQTDHIYEKFPLLPCPAGGAIFFRQIVGLEREFAGLIW
jgi:hypothetical protein